DIVAAVRERGGGDVTLHIIGTANNRTYEAQLVERARSHPWVTIHRNLSREELVQLLARHRYGLHGMAEEHFGIAVPPILSAPAIPFVPPGGGPGEIGRGGGRLWRSP